MLLLALAPHLYGLPVDSSTAQLSAAAIGAGAVLLGTALTQIVAFLTESRRRQWEIDSRWHEERRRLASALISESIRFERNVRTHFDYLPTDGSLRTQMRALGYRDLDDLPDDVSIDDLEENLRGAMLADLLHYLNKHIEKTQQDLADLTMLSGDPVARLARKLDLSLWIVRRRVGGLLPQELVEESMTSLLRDRINFQRAIRDELNGTKPPRLWRQRVRASAMRRGGGPPTSHEH